MEIRNFKKYTRTQKMATLCYNYVVIFIYFSLIVGIINFDIHRLGESLLLFLGNYFIYAFFMLMAFKKKPGLKGYLKSYKMI